MLSSSHLATEEQRTLDDFSQISKRLELVLDGLDLRIGPGSRATWSGIGLNLLKLPHNLRVLAETLIAQVEILHDDPVCIQDARIRAVLNRAPSHVKESRKDCEILEHALALSRRLEGAGHGLRRVLVTSNTTDFNLRELGREMSDAKLDLVFDLSDAHGCIGRP